MQNKQTALILEKKIQQQEKQARKTKSKKKIRINSDVRLVPYDRFRKESLSWYQNPLLMKNIVGKKVSYSKEKILKLYKWQNKHGSLYYIEYKTDDTFVTIGDVWMTKDDYAIVLDPNYQNKKIGRLVTRYFIHKAKKRNQKFMVVKEVFHWNQASHKMFQSLSFQRFKEEKDFSSYRKRLSEPEK